MKKRYFRWREEALWKEKNVKKGMYMPGSILKSMPFITIKTVSPAAILSKMQKTFVIFFYSMNNICLSSRGHLQKLKSGYIRNTIASVMRESEIGCISHYYNSGYCIVRQCIDPC